MVRGTESKWVGKDPSGHNSFLLLPLDLDPGLFLTWESSSPFCLVASFHAPPPFLPVYLSCKGRWLLCNRGDRQLPNGLGNDTESSMDLIADCVWMCMLYNPQVPQFPPLP